MSTIHFSLGRNTYDNQPAQRTAADFDDFVTQISNTGSTRKGQAYICASLAKGPHTETTKYRGFAHWRIRNLAQPCRFLSLDVDFFSSPSVFVDFQKEVSQWNSMVYTTSSHQPNTPHARAIIELSRDVGYAEQMMLGDAVQRMLESKLGQTNITLDPCVYRATQPIFLPLVNAQITRYMGAALDVDAVLKQWPAPVSSPSLIGLGINGSNVTPGPLPSFMLALIAPPETQVEISKVKAALAKVSSDCPYSVWINILFALRSTGWACSEALARQWSMSSPHRYDAVVFAKVWHYAKPLGGITIGTLYFYANQVKPAASMPTTAGVNSANSVRNMPSGRLIIPTSPPPSRKYVLGDVLVAGTVGVMAGVGSSAKTTAAIQFSINGVFGKKIGDFEISRFASALFLAEESADERDRRFGALCSKLTPSEISDVQKFVYCEASAGQDLRLTALVDGHVHHTLQVDRIIEAVQNHQNQCGIAVRLVVIDHARLVMAGDPISSEHVTALLRALTWIASNTGAAVLLLAHSPKSTYGKDGEADPSEIFGSGAFVDHARAAFVLRVMREKEAKQYGLSDVDRKDHVCLQTVKANYAPNSGIWWFKKEVVPNWQAIELVPAVLFPKGHSNTLSNLGRKITDLVKAHPGQLSSRALRDKYAGTNRLLGASEQKVREALQRLIDDGTLLARAPTKLERDKYRLSANIKEVLDLLPTVG